MVTLVSISSTVPRRGHGAINLPPSKVASVEYTDPLGGDKVFVVEPLKEKKMDPVTHVKLEDVNGQPVAKRGDLPSPLRVGDPLGLKFRISRRTNGREEVLDVRGQFRVTAVGFDATVAPPRQLLSGESVSAPPKWRSVKKPSERRPLAPLRSPRTPI